MAETQQPGGEGNAAQIAYWNDKAAETWTAFQERIDAVFAPLTARALVAAAPQPGERVVDVGCGCGATLLELAARVGPAGRVTGLDVSAPMAARARERIAAAGLANATVRLADAATEPLPADDADLLFSRFGVMFFADPVAAFATLRTAMRPSGRLLFASWRPLAENGWFAVPLGAGLPLLPPQPEADPEAPGPFAFANPDRVRRILAEAGWRDIGITPENVPMCIARPGQIEDAVDFATRVGALARILAEVDRDVRRAVRSAVAAALAPYDGPDGIVLSGAIWLVSARS